MRYFELLKTIKNISTTHVLVNEYGEGDIYEHLNSGEHKYPCVFLTVTNIQSSVSSTLYNFTLFYTDRLLESGDNRTNIQSTGINVIQQILNRLIQEYPTYEVTNINFTPFTEKFADMCAGVFCDVTFEDPVENLESTIDSECNEGDFEIQTITLTKNGLYDINGYDKAVVAIPLTELEITEEGTYVNDNGGWNKVTVGEMAKVQEHVEVEIDDIANEWTYVTPDEGYDGIGEVAIHNTTINKLHTKSQTLTSNGTYSITPNSGYKGMSKVTVNVNTPTPTQLTVTQNGTWTRNGGYNPVIVNTPKYEIISLNQKQYNELEDYNEFAVYLITYDNTIPSVEGDYFYIESQEDSNEISFIANTEYDDMTNCIAYNISHFEVSTNLYDWYKLDNIATEVDWGYYTVTLNKYDRLFIRNVYGEFLTNFYEYKNFMSIVSEATKHFSIGGDLHTVIFKYTDRITELPNKSLYLRDIFSFVSNLIDASDLILPATKLPNRAYSGMFSGCSDLIYAPKNLPATDLEQNVYQEMFKWCHSLVEAPELPATTLNYGCYSYMFYACTSLVKAPELPAINLPVTNYAHQGCYNQMFNQCTNLNYVKCLGLNDISFNTSIMLGNVSSTGTFIKHPDAEWVIGNYGIPSGWTVENANIEEI